MSLWKFNDGAVCCGRCGQVLLWFVDGTEMADVQVAALEHEERCGA